MSPLASQVTHVRNLERRLAEAEATIEALLSGQIDAVVDTKTRTPVLLAKAQDALRESETRYRRIVETTNQGVWLLDAENKTAFMNRRMAEMLRCEDDMGAGRSPADFLDEAGRAQLAVHIERKASTQTEFKFVRTDGTEFWALLDATAEYDSAGRYTGAFAMIMDITERKRAEAALVASEARFRRLWESGILLIMISDLSGTIIDINECGAQMLGYSRAELLANRIRWDDITPAGSHAADEVARAQLVAGGVASPWQKELIRKDGTRVTILAAAALLGGTEGIAIAIDLTDRMRAEATSAALESQLRQSQKMEAIGRLAGGIAHDFNNILSVILSSGEFLLEDLKPMDPARMDVEEIHKAGTRAAALTRQLLMFSRQQVLEPKVLDLGAVTAGMESMLRRVIGEDIELVLVSDDRLGRVRVDAGSIEQVIMNLAVNARDAMPNGGTLTIATQNAILDGTSPQVVLSMTDTGTGMDAETQARIFEPFFTTKDVGNGTGLGLSTVFGIVEQSGGTMRFDSTLGVGTAFHIYLPQVDDAADAPASRPAAARGGTETIMLVEDEDQVRAVASAILKRQGYQVIEMRGPEDALMYCLGRPEPIHLLLTDVVMPQMSGPELARQLVAVRPKLRVLCMSGYTDDRIMRLGVLNADVAFLHKPFTSDSLTRRVREVLDAEPAA